MMEISRRMMLRYGLGGLVLTAAGCKPVLAPASPTPADVPASTVPPMSSTTTTMAMPMPKPSGDSGTGARWSDPATWGGSVPKPGDQVVVDHAVVLDTNPVVGSLRITPGGSLSFDPGASHVLESRGNVIVQGMLVMEPSAPAVQHRILFSGVDERKYVGGGMTPLDSDVGLWVMDNGMLHLCGSERSGWARAAAPLAAGDKAVMLDRDPTGWQVGDELTITPSDTGGYETVHVTGISGRIVSIDTALATARPLFDVGRGRQFGAEVLNLTRNVVITGQPGKKAHMFIHSMMEQDICHTTFQYLGPQQTASDGPHDVLGRYAVHFHHCMDGSRGSTIESCVVRDCGAHAYVPHVSNGVTFRDCVAHNTTDPAYWYDARDSSADTLWDGCVASATKHNEPFKYTNAGFVHGFGPDGRNTARNCVAVGVDGSGFFWDADSESVWVFEDDLAHHCTEAGARVWQNDDLPHVITRFIAYRNDVGVSHGAYGNAYHYSDCQLVGNASAAMTVAAVSVKPSNGLVFDRMLFDASGADYAVQSMDGSAVGPFGETLYSSCTFTGSKKAAFAVMPHNDERPNSVLLQDCTFAGNEFWFDPTIGPKTVIEVDDASHGHVFLRKPGSSGTAMAKWNATVSSA
jgi:G8 domain